MRILVVDDQETNRAILVWLLEDDGHEVIEAKDGLEAVNLFQASSIDIVLMDVMMPVMDGLEAAKNIKELCGDSRHVPIIFLTALEDDKALSECLDSGGDDFLSKPYNEAVLKAKIAAHLRIRELTEQIKEKNTELTLHNSRWEREKNIVSHIFNRALEHNLSDCRNLRSHIAPASTFNGDILLSAPSPGGGLYVFLGDFTGHGLGASIGTLPIANSFDQLVNRHLSVGEIAYEFNRMLLTMLPDYMFCCATLLELNASGNSVQLWSGGLPDGYIIAADGSIKEPLVSKNIPLGIESNENFNKAFEIKKLEEGEKIILLTDGIIEAENPNGEFFTEEGFKRAFTKGTKDSMNSLLEKLSAFTQGAEQNDDITLVEVSSGQVVIEDQKIQESIQYDGILWNIRFNLSATDLQQANPVEEIMSVLGAQTLLRPNRDVIGLLLAELYSNALEHGILELSSDMKKTEEGFVEYYNQRKKRLLALENAYIKLSCKLLYDDDEELVLRIKMEDSGVGFDVDGLMERGGGDSFGRGVSLIHRVCKRTQYMKNGSAVETDFPVNQKLNESN
ncbi:SpoIIE family protein phosphatase [Bermanella sp. WJH001]|uniref:SpoIIE family protein phosphatase n=1 Tax=Bermanella sp. WJH001 TaxID=3048005 RepID=UPI0024BEFF40|nr:SpoIIE family protein phosphatase [Bermanella sp. WJH001]MDJ1536623.1 SpoIIE family protein phosphatase [Bermanella sp. WJH001]